MIEKKHITKKVIKNIESIIFPTLSSLRRKSAPAQQRQIDVLQKNLREITSDFGVNIASNKWRLSDREIEVCNLIKEGVTTSGIAEILCTSKRTIDNHRNHIRKKLGISNDQISLKEYLRSLG